LFLNYELTDSLRFDAELWYARTEAKQMVAQPYFNSNTFGGIPINNYGNVGQGPVPVLIDNPFLTDATRANMTAALNVVHDFTGDGVADPTIDTDGDGIPDAVGFWRGGPLNVAGDSDYWTEQDTYRVVLGLDGDVPFRDDTLLWDAAYTYGRVEIANSTVAIHQPNFEQAVQVTADANGMPACVDPSGGCAPLDVVGTPSQQAIDYVTQQVTDHTTTEQHIVSANIAGDVVEVPAGPLGAAIGALYRQENVKFDPNDLSRAGLTRFSSADPLNESFSSTELYAEVLVPLLGGYMDTPLIDTLEFEGAIRYVDNSVVGSDTTWTVGLRYRPIDDIEFRGNITESIRAPSMGELFLPETVVFAFADDPCDSRFITQGNVPDTRAANCAADGIVQPFQSIVVNAAQQGVSGGNPNLDSEIAESISYGVVLRPRFWDQFTMSIDWFDIQIDNAIENLALGDIMIACYDSSSFSSEPACDLFTRDAMGQIANFREGMVNVAVIEFAGLQAVAQFNTELGRFGALDISLNYMFTERHEETPGSGNTQFYDGTVGISKHRVTMGITWDIGNWTWYNQFRWLDSAVFDNADDEFTRNISEIDDWLLVNSSLEYRFSDQFDVQLVIDNLFDTDPPFAAMSRGFSGMVYYPGILGRYARIQARYAF
jgi:outer membrane receptor protein involved in Fe transport